MKEKSSLFIERLKATVFGAVIFVMDLEGRVLTVKELENKASTGKSVGQASCVSETAEPGELPQSNITRAFTEELGIATDRFSEVLDFMDYTLRETSYIPGVKNTKGVWATVLKITCTDPEKLMSLIGSDKKPDGVEVIGFKTRQEFEALDLRPGVRNIMNKFGDEIFAK